MSNRKASGTHLNAPLLSLLEARVSWLPPTCVCLDGCRVNSHPNSRDSQCDKWFLWILMRVSFLYKGNAFWDNAHSSSTLVQCCTPLSNISHPPYPNQQLHFLHQLYPPNPNSSPKPPPHSNQLHPPFPDIPPAPPQMCTIWMHPSDGTH